LQQNAFNMLINNIINSVVLAFPDFQKPFHLRTDASEVGCGAVLYQKDHNGRELPISFISRSLSKAERNYHAAERECLCIIWALKKYEHYLDGIPFHLETDNRALIWLNSMRDVNSKFVRWALKIQDFQPIIVHCPGKYNVVADALSRAPTGEVEDEDAKQVMDPPITHSLLTFSLPFSTTINLDSIRAAQQDDSEVQALLTDLPPDLTINDNILFKKTKTGALLPYIPSSMRNEVLKYFHDSPHSGHMGYRKTINRLLRRVFWIRMQKDIYDYVRSCNRCQNVKNPMSRPHGMLQPVKVHGPWDMIAIDLVGPLPKTRYGKEHILVIVDHFSKWVELFPIKDTKAQTIIPVLEKEIFCRWGSPKSMLSDNATYFRGKDFQNMCKVWGIHHKFTTPYHPSGNICERVNRNIRAILSSYIESNQKKWDEYLHTTALALRTAISDTTGFSPSMLNLGRELMLPLDRNIENEYDGFESRVLYQTELTKKLASIYQKAIANIEKSQEQQSRYYNLRHKKFDAKVGDFVLIRTHVISSKIKQITKKFSDRWYGPFKVIRIITPVTFELGKIGTNESVGTQNAANLKLYFDKPSSLSFVDPDNANALR